MLAASAGAALRRRGHLRVGRFYNCLLGREAGRLAARGRAGHGRRAPETEPLRRARSTGGAGRLSCSDKILKWSVCRLPGALLRARFPDDIPLKGVVVSAQPDAATLEQALDRALFQRAEYLAAACHQRPPLLRTRVTDAAPVAARGRRKASSLIVAWWRGCGAPEIMIAATGRPRGATEFHGRPAPRDGVFSREARRPRPRGAALRTRRGALDVAVREVCARGPRGRSTHPQLPPAVCLVPEEARRRLPAWRSMTTRRRGRCRGDDTPPCCCKPNTRARAAGLSQQSKPASRAVELARDPPARRDRHFASRSEHADAPGDVAPPRQRRRRALGRLRCSVPGR